MSNNTEIKEFKTELCAQPKSWFLMIFNFGRSLIRCTWAVFLILTYTCNSSWSGCSWGAKIHLLVLSCSQSSFFTSEMSILSSVWTVLRNKQTNKTCEISCLELSWQINCHITCFLFLLGCFRIRKTQSMVFKLEMCETNADRQRDTD